MGILFYLRKTMRNSCKGLFFFILYYFYGLKTIKMIQRTLEAILKEKIDYKKVLLVLGPRHNQMMSSPSILGI